VRDWHGISIGDGGIALPDQALPTVKLSGAVELRNIEEAFEKVKAAYDEGEGFEIDLSAVTDLDLTLVQLIESARRGAAASGKMVRLSAPARGMVKEALQRGGFLSEPADERTQFWLG
jgi:ABC-type transporter Mla MlaB component